MRFDFYLPLRFNLLSKIAVFLFTDFIFVSLRAFDVSIKMVSLGYQNAYLQSISVLLTNPSLFFYGLEFTMAALIKKRAASLGDSVLCHFDKFKPWEVAMCCRTFHFWNLFPRLVCMIAFQFACHLGDITALLPVEHCHKILNC